MCFGGGGEQQAPPEPQIIYYPVPSANPYETLPTTNQGPVYDPYQQYSGGGAGIPGGAEQILSGNVPPSSGSTFYPTSGGNVNYIPGAYQMLRMKNSPQYLW